MASSDDEWDNAPEDDSEDEFVATIEQKIRDFTRVQGGDRTRVHKIRVRSFDPKEVASIHQ